MDIDGQIIAMIVVGTIIFVLWRYVTPALQKYKTNQARGQIENNIEWQNKIKEKYGVDAIDEMQKQSEHRRKISEIIQPL